MTHRASVLEAVKALGKDCTFAQAKKWLTDKYGKKNATVSDATFYVVRKEYRESLEKGKTSAQLVAEAQRNENPVQDEAQRNENPAQYEAQTQVEKEITFSDMEKVAIFLKEIGGVRRLLNVLDCFNKVQKLEVEIAEDYARSVAH